MISVLTPIKYEDVIKEVREPLITAFAIANLLVVLPILVDSCKKLIDNIKPQVDEDIEITDSPIDVIIPASFNFPNMGKLMSLAFIPFAAWYVGTPLNIAQYPTFLAAGIPVFFADATLGTLFLLSLFKIPTNMLNIFITVEVFTGRFGTIVAGMYTVALAIISTCAMEGLLRFPKRKLIRFGLASALVIALVLGSVHAVFSYVFPQSYNKNDILVNLEPLRIRQNPDNKIKIYQGDQTIDDRLGEQSPKDLSRLEIIQQSKALRVCYEDKNYPLAYSNAKGQLVGMDIEMSYILAKDLGVNAEFVALKPQELWNFPLVSQRLNSKQCDLVSPSIPISPQGEAYLNFSDSFVNRSLGFLVNSDDKQKFTSWRKLQAIPNLKIAVPANAPYFTAKIKGLLPNAQLSFIASNNVREFLEADFAKYDALVISAETGSALTLLYPNNAVAVPQPAVKFPISYMLPENTPEFSDTFNVWLSLKRTDGTINSLYDYWIKGNLSSVQEPRWSIIRNVLGWMP